MYRRSLNDAEEVTCNVYMSDCIQEVPDRNFCQVTGDPQDFHDFPRMQNSKDGTLKQSVVFLPSSPFQHS